MLHTRSRLASLRSAHVELAQRLKKHGFKDEAEASITNKLKRGKFSFVSAGLLCALEADGLRLEDV
jgi:hypothetical protein